MTHLFELRWMLPPLAMCLVLTGIHGYLGIHVLSRKVIFVDLALAQIAALGTTYALLLGYDPGSPEDARTAYLFSLGFTFVGAAVFSLARMRSEKVPQEAFIGIVYAMASAVAILLLAKSPGEGERIKEMLVGNVLLVTWPQVVKTAAIYLVIGTFHYFFRKPFFEISLDHEGALQGGRNVRGWDFLFYASFGFVITSSVAIAGVLLVFSFLVVPAVIAFMYREGIGARILVAWSVGTVCSAAGMIVSYYGDLPTGPSVVACFAVLLVLAGIGHYVRASERRAGALGRVAIGVVVTASLLGLSTNLRKAPKAHAHGADFQAMVAALAEGDENQQIEAVHHLAELKDPHAVPILVKELETSSQDRVIEHVVQVLPEFADPSAVPALVALASKDIDPYLKVEVASSLLKLRSPGGFDVIRSVLEEESALMVQQQAQQLLVENLGNDFGLGKATTPEARAQAVTRLKTWLGQHETHLRWRPDLKRFE